MDSPRSAPFSLMPVIALMVGVAGLLMWRVARAPGTAASTPPAATAAPAANTPATLDTPIYPTGSASAPPAPSTPPASGALPTVAGATTAVRLVEPVTCSKVDPQRGTPVDNVSTYSEHQPFFCSVQAFGLRNGTRLVACWRGPGLTSNRTLICHRVGDYVIWFRLDAPHGGWAPGHFTVSLLADGVLEQTVLFDVVSRLADLGIDGAVPCRATDPTHRPLHPTTTFRAHDPLIASVRVRHLRRGQEVETRWYRGRTDQLKALRIRLRRAGAGYLAYALKPRPAWKPGAYRVEVYVDGQFACKAEFQVLP